MLPKQVQKNIKESDGKVVGAVGTIYEVELIKDGQSRIINRNNYDFSKSDDILMYNNFVNNIIQTVTISLIDRESNKGTLFEQTAASLTEGAVLSKIVYGTYQGTPFEMKFTYHDNNKDTSASNWGVYLIDLIWSTVGLPTPPGFSTTSYPSNIVTRNY